MHTDEEHIDRPGPDAADLLTHAIEIGLDLFEVLPDEQRAMVVLAAGTGLRQGECFGLTVPRLDMPRRVVRVEQQLVTVVGTPSVLSPPKAKASHRTVPLPGIVADELA